MKIKKLAKLHKDTEAFLLDYANCKYGKYGKDIKVTKSIVKKFMDKASEFDLEEALSYTRKDIIEDMLSDMSGASDLEDWIKHVINREEE